MVKKQGFGIILLFITAFIWGLAFIAQSKGMELVEPFTFSATRMLIGGVALLPIVIFLDFKKIKNGDRKEKWSAKEILKMVFYSVAFWV
jgi:drug/metabolite transporter (DMT)-like permease